MKNIFTKSIATLSFIGVLIVNYLANSLPINNRSTGAISDDYTNLFTPAGITFSIWGLIYLALATYVIYQFVQFGNENKEEKESLLNKINILFIATSVANISWIFAWHYDYIGISLIIMIIFLILLIKIANIINFEKLNIQSKIFVMIPFSLYFGWITIATIANVSVFLVSLGYRGFWLSEAVLTIITLSIGAIIGILGILKAKNIVYGLVFIWAYLGILIKHISIEGLNMQYPGIIVTISICLFIFIVSVGKIALYKRK